MQQIHSLILKRQEYTDELISNLQLFHDQYIKQNVLDIKINYLSQVQIFEKLDKFDVIIITLAIPLLFLILILSLKILKYTFKIGSKLLSFKYWKSVFLNSSIVRKEVNKNIKKTTDEIRADLLKSVHKQQKELPVNGLKVNRLQERIKEWKKLDEEKTDFEKLSGSIYIEQGELKDSIKEFSQKYMFMDLKDRETMNSIRQMENEVIQMTIQLLNGSDNSVNSLEQTSGILTQGGTESIFLAMLAYREYYKKDRPNIVICKSAHVAFDKASHYLGIEVRRVGQDQNYMMNIAETKKQIDCNTICIVGSAPNYASGIIDDFQQLGQLANKYKVGLHVDCCLGGFLLCFAEKTKLEGIEFNRDFDFRNQNVTSLSIDHHKYGLAPKGLSCVLFKNQQLRQGVFYININSKQPLYYNTGLCENVSAIALAGGWYAMMHNGQNKYISITKSILQATQNLLSALAQISDISICGRPYLNIIAITSNNPKINIYSLQNALTTHHWELNALQDPPSFHICITQANCKKVHELPKLIIQSIKQILENPQKYKGGSCAVYGSTAQIPDASILNDVLKSVQDAIIKC